jgi:hypothetical protein
MVEKIKDAEDRWLESVFQSEPVADDGFSRRVLRRIRRRLWVRRLAMPVAILVGGAVAIEPATQLVTAASKLLSVVPQDLLDVPATWFPQIQLIVIGAMLLAAAVLGMSMLEE